ncbi:MAG: hypothetical protein D6790_10025, partial [Caldilineae bacterium]
MDERHGFVYVASRNATPEGNRGVVSTVHLATGDVLRRALLPVVDGNPLRGRLILGQDGRLGYILDQDSNQLFSYNPLTNRAVLIHDEAWNAYLSPDETTILIQNRDGLHAYTPDLEERLWSAPIGLLDDVAVSMDAVLVSASKLQGYSLTIYDLITGAKRTSLVQEEWIDTIAPGPDGSWFVATSNGKRPVLRRVGADLSVITEIDGLSVANLFYDARRERVIYSGFRPGLTDNIYVSQVLNAEDLALIAERRWPDWRYPDELQSTNTALVGIRTYDENDRLYILDPETLDETGRVILGVRLGPILVDEDRGALFISDNQERIHKIDMASGEITAVWRGQASMTLDPANGRLYANRVDAGVRHVVALDEDTGAVLATFPQGGDPAADPQRNLVYIVDVGITVYDRAGRKLGRLDSSFPTQPDFAYIPFIFKVVVNPVTGGLVAFGNNGVPGSNNRDFVRFYAPPEEEDGLPPDEPIRIPELDDRLVTVAFDRETGDAYLADGSFRSILGIQRVSPDGEILAQVRGR